MINLYLITRNKDLKPNYDAARGFVIAAESEMIARNLAADAGGDEPRIHWLELEYSTIEHIGMSHRYQTRQIIMRDFNAG